MNSQTPPHRACFLYRIISEKQHRRNFLFFFAIPTTICRDSKYDTLRVTFNIKIIRIQSISSFSYFYSRCSTRVLALSINKEQISQRRRVRTFRIAQAFGLGRSVCYFSLSLSLCRLPTFFSLFISALPFFNPISHFALDLALNVYKIVSALILMRKCEIYLCICQMDECRFNFIGFARTFNFVVDEMHEVCLSFFETATLFRSITRQANYDAIALVSYFQATVEYQRDCWLYSWQFQEKKKLYERTLCRPIKPTSDPFQRNKSINISALIQSDLCFR